MKKLLAVLLCLGLTGCATANSVPTDQCQRGLWPSSDGVMFCNNYEIEFISDPPGAKVEINGDYVGETPFKRNWNGEYSIYNNFKIIAYPTMPGQFTQTKTISFNEGLPRRIYFEMDLGPQAPSVEG